jgi:hypothetical protein
MVNQRHNEVSYPSDKLFFESFESSIQPLWDILAKAYWNQVRHGKRELSNETEFN